MSTHRTDILDAAAAAINVAAFFVPQSALRSVEELRQ